MAVNTRLVGPGAPGGPITMDGWDMTDLMTTQEVMAVFRVGNNTVVRWAKERRLVSIRPSARVYRFSRQQVNAIVTGAAEPSGPAP